MNTTIFHLRQVDELEELLRETSDLSIYCFYPHLFDAHLKQCLNFPLQSRYVIVYPQLTSHFVNSLHEMCPEERNFIVDRGKHFDIFILILLGSHLFFKAPFTFFKIILKNGK